MLGVYEQFPLNVHKIKTFTTSISIKKLQQTLIQTFYKINNKDFKLEDIALPSLPQCIAIFEFGIAEANNFNYLNEEETNKGLRAIRKKPFQVLDFFCALRYYKINNEKKTPLKFDYYMIRFIFNKNLIKMQVFHEKGPRYASPEDIANFIADKTNENFSKKALKTLEKV
ncbi:hypothetical protein HXY32_05870 [Candidatus Bathyarchaeota archaeon]|nr:hypothetical protein [Candidatus Bathyarchaeota archaeon]